MFYKLFLALVLAAGTTAYAEDSSTPLNPNNPPALADYRMNYRDMVEIANDKRLPHRIFYAPSSGPDATWFDAVKKGDLASVKRMREQGQNLEAKDEAALGQTALGWAAFIGYEDLVRYLVSQGADLFATDRGDVQNVLKSATLGQNVAVFKFLHEQLKDKVDLNDTKTDQQGETLLMIAASNDRVQIVKYLLSQHVELNIVSRPLGQDALTSACSRGNLDVAALLIEAGAINHHTGKANCVD